MWPGIGLYCFRERRRLFSGTFTLLDRNRYGSLCSCRSGFEWRRQVGSCRHKLHHRNYRHHVRRRRRTFPTHSDYPVGSEPTSVAIADLNGDGNPDVVVPNFHSNTLSVLFGNGDGSFKSAVSYATGNGPISVAAADFNGDHKLDLVVVNESKNDVGILLGNGNGTFKAQVTYSTGAGGNPLSVQVGDFNGDNNLDLAVADFHTQQVSILIGNGDGTFQPVKAYATGANPSSVVMADFNGDGKLDLALTSTPLASSAGNLLSLLPGNGDGTFRAPTVFGTGSE